MEWHKDKSVLRNWPFIFACLIPRRVCWCTFTSFLQSVHSCCHWHFVLSHEQCNFTQTKFLFDLNLRWNILVRQRSRSVQTLIYLQTTGTRATGKGKLIQSLSCVWCRLWAVYMQFSWRLFNLSGWPFCNSKQSLWSRAAEKAERSRAHTQTAPLACSVSNSRCILLLSLFIACADAAANIPLFARI